MVSRYLHLTCLRCDTAILLQSSSFTVRCISFTSSDSSAFDSNKKSGKPDHNTKNEKKKKERIQYLNDRSLFRTHEGNSFAHRLLMEDKKKDGMIKNTHERNSFTYRLLTEDKKKDGMIKNTHEGTSFTQQLLMENEKKDGMIQNVRERKHKVSIKDGTTFKKPYISSSYEKSVHKAAANVAFSMKEESVAKTLLHAYESSKKSSYTDVKSKDTPLNMLSIMNKMRTVKAHRHEQNSITKTAFTEKLADVQTIIESLSDILGKKPTNTMQLFSNDLNTLIEDPVPLKTWRMLEKQELQQFVTHAPTNGFEEMIQWTNDGKLWKFPIDNEQGMEEEQNVHFSKHVFLEHHLNGWCPKKGPVRHFMELICIGLSKNPYLTVEEKFNHIMWYKDYFAQKQNLLMDLGALEAPITDPPNTIES